MIGFVKLNGLSKVLQTRTTRTAFISESTLSSFVTKLPPESVFVVYYIAHPFSQYPCLQTQERTIFLLYGGRLEDRRVAAAAVAAAAAAVTAADDADQNEAGWEREGQNHNSHRKLLESAAVL